MPQGLTITLCRRWGRFGAYHIPATLQAAHRNKAGGRTAPGCCSAPVPWSSVLSADLRDLNNHVLKPKPSYFGAWICSFNSLEPALSLCMAVSRGGRVGSSCRISSDAHLHSNPNGSVSQVLTQTLAQAENITQA